MTTSEQMGVGRRAPLINRNFAAAGRFQWVREGLINALQANATLAEFTTEWEAAANIGVHRRVLLDNGTGMVGREMPGFLNKFGGSGKTIGDTTENYGVGLKSGTLPWNQYGLVVISKRDEELSMMWLRYDDSLA